MNGLAQNVALTPAFRKNNTRASVCDIPLAELRARAVEWNAERYIKRHCVNYARHMLTTYDWDISPVAHLPEQALRVFVAHNDGIAERWPELADECARQNAARTARVNGGAR